MIERKRNSYLAFFPVVASNQIFPHGKSNDFYKTKAVFLNYFFEILKKQRMYQN